MGFSRGLPARVPKNDRAHAVVQQELAAPAEVFERRLVCCQQVGHALPKEALREATPAVAQRHHEDMHGRAHAPKRHGGLPPVALGLLTRAGLEAALRQRRHGGSQAQWRDRAAHDDVAAGKASVRTQLPARGCAPSS